MLVVKWDWELSGEKPYVDKFYDQIGPTLFEVMERYITEGAEFVILKRWVGPDKGYDPQAHINERHAHAWERETTEEEE